MRLRSRTSWIVAGAAALGIAGAVVLAGGVRADDDDEDDAVDPAEIAAKQKVADEAMAKAIARGKEIWNGADEKLLRKPCTKCHDDPDKPKLNLATRPYSYPAYFPRKKHVITLQQKIQLMITNSSKGKAFDPEGADIAALEAYVVSLRKK